MSEKYEGAEARASGTPDTAGPAADLALEAAGADSSLRADVAAFLRNQNSLIDNHRGNSPILLKRMFSRHDLIAIGLTGSIIATAIIWNAFVGLTWTANTFVAVFPAMLLFALSTGYRVFRPAEERLAQFTLYSALWLAYPFFIVQLTFLSSALGFPEQDALLSRYDAFLGFRWIDWAQFVAVHPTFVKIQVFAYESFYWQPLLAIASLAFSGSNRKNAIFLVSILVAAVITVFISGFIPALGAGETYHMPNGWSAVVHAVRSGHVKNVPYVGIVSFPSFHATMAVFFALIFAEKLIFFAPAALFNCLMLISILYCGQHYLVDIAGGICIVPVSYWISCALLKLAGASDAFPCRDPSLPLNSSQV